MNAAANTIRDDVLVDYLRPVSVFATNNLKTVVSRAVAVRRVCAILVWNYVSMSAEAIRRRRSCSQCIFRSIFTQTL